MPVPTHLFLRRKTLRRALPACAAALLQAACNPMEPPVSDPAVPGVLEMAPHDPPHIRMPETVRAGEPFQVHVTTYGDGCSRIGRMEWEYDETSADLRPLDHQVSDRPSCTRRLRLHPHEALLTFPKPGSGTVRIHGRRLPGGEEITITRTVTIQ